MNSVIIELIYAKIQRDRFNITRLHNVIVGAEEEL
jgi:hypothetical protein